MGNEGCGATAGVVGGRPVEEYNTRHEERENIVVWSE